MREYIKGKDLQKDVIYRSRANVKYSYQVLDNDELWGVENSINLGPKENFGQVFYIQEDKSSTKMAEWLRQQANALNLPILNLEDALEDIRKYGNVQSSEFLRIKNAKIDLYKLMNTLEKKAKELENV
jgi:hypothetical protein